MRIRNLVPQDQREWTRMRQRLWPNWPGGARVPEADEVPTDEFCKVFVAEAGPGRLVGFIEVGIHPFLDDGQAHTVASIDGWYVDADFRGQGVGTRLAETAEEWAKAHGCSAITSDCAPDDAVAYQIHQALGFSETLRLIHFAKPLRGRPQ